jgi:hypothetical protein
MMMNDMMMNDDAIDDDAVDDDDDALLMIDAFSSACISPLF